MSLGAKKVAGVLALFIVVCACTAILSPFFLDAFNIENLLRRSALFGIISIGAAFVIMTGGIDGVFGGSPLWIDVTCISPVHGTGEPMPQAAINDGRH